MKLKIWRKILVAIIFISSIVTVIFVTYKVVKTNNTEVVGKTTNMTYKPVVLPKTDKYKVLKENNGKIVFNLANMEYYLINKTLILYPELANRQFSFKTNSDSYPTSLSMSISTTKSIEWFYSII